MDVVAARGFAEDDFLRGRVERGEADGAIAVDGFAVGWGGLVWSGGGGGDGRVGGGEDLAQFGAEECELVLEVFGGFEDVVQDLYLCVPRQQLEFPPALWVVSVMLWAALT